MSERLPRARHCAEHLTLSYLIIYDRPKMSTIPGLFLVKFDDNYTSFHRRCNSLFPPSKKTKQNKITKTELVSLHKLTQNHKYKMAITIFNNLFNGSYILQSKQVMLSVTEQS